MYKDLVNAFAGQRVLVVGDVMLDEYIWGEVRRISPEAPIPIVETKQRSYRPGGASNVAATIASLGGLPQLCGVVGRDALAGVLAGVLAEYQVQVDDGLLAAADRPTTVKSRVMAHGQQMLRLDHESHEPISLETEDAVIAWVGAHLPGAGACVLSDYAKGVLSHRVCQAIIALGRQAGIPVVVDPKGQQYHRYAGATVITPNVREAAIAANHLTERAPDLEKVAAFLLDLLDGTSLLITRSEEGMSLYRRAEAPLHIPAEARSVYDVTGAGDTAIGALALALAAGAPLELAAGVANFAAGVVVGKVGTATVTVPELLAAMHEAAGEDVVVV